MLKLNSVYWSYSVKNELVNFSILYNNILEKSIGRGNVYTHIALL